jgi:hypothetical protein
VQENHARAESLGEGLRLLKDLVGQIGEIHEGDDSFHVAARYSGIASP